jgi:inhibitor of KinA sporulation pathway (predicted exonuclease)
VAKRLLDKLLVVDVEATCWEGSAPAGQESEIIEIGICTFDVASGDRLQKQSILVRPEHSTVSPFCTQLTTLTQQQVEQGVSFAEACTLLKEQYLSQQRVWASYGEYDRQQFERQCHSRGLSYPFGSRHMNIKVLFALMYALPREVGMAEALHRVNLPLEGTHHRGDDDAWNIAALCSAILKQNRLSQ